MNHVVTDSGKLRRAWSQYQAKRKQKKPLLPTEMEAAAECAFRLSTRSGTAQGEAIELLHEAVALDGGNPKYAYHLARIYLTIGELHRASIWLSHAGRLCPTNHRIWSHIALLQWELNKLYYGDDRYQPDSLRRRGESISQAIHQERDDFESDWLSFVPAKTAVENNKSGSTETPAEKSTSPDKNGESADTASPIPRRTRARECRWSGVRDIIVENMLEARANQTQLERMLPIFNEIARLSTQRRGGIAAFAILSVQWILSGYPLATVRRLIAGFDVARCQSLASYRLLMDVCDIYELPESQVPSRLASLIAEGRMPPLLASVIHRRRVLWRPLEYRAFAHYRHSQQHLAACRFPAADEEAQAVRDSTATELATKLWQNLEQFVRKLPESLQDVEPTIPSSSDAALDVGAELASLEDIVIQIESCKKESFQHCLASARAAAAKPTTDELAILGADLRELTPLVVDLKQALQDLLSRVDKLVAAAKTQPNKLPADFLLRHESCDKMIKELVNFGAFDRQLKALTKSLTASGQALTTANPSSLVAEMRRMAMQVASRAKVTPAAADKSSEPDPATALSPSQITANLNDLWASLLKLTGDGVELSPADVSAAIELRGTFDELLKSCDKALEAIDAQRKSGQVDAAKIETLDSHEKELLNASQRRGAFIKRFKRLPAAATPVPSAEPGNSTAGTASSGGNESPSRWPPIPARQELQGTAALQEVCQATWSMIVGSFEAALSTFDPWPKQAQMPAPYRAILASVRGRFAETCYRLQRRSLARELWCQIALDDPYNVDALKHLALSEIGGVDAGKSLSLWKNYFEQLCLFDIVGADLSAHAAERIELHLALGDCQPPSFLFETSKEKRFEELIDWEAAVSFLVNGDRVRAFVDHKLLWFLERQFSHKAPHLVLGVTRRKDPELWKMSHDTIRAFAQEACRRLPTRLFKPFAALCQKRLDRARSELDNALPSWRAEADPAEEAERTAHMELLSDIAQLKVRLHTLLVKNPELPKRMTSLKPLADLLRLDSIPLTQTEDFAATLAGSFGFEDPRELQELIQATIRRAVQKCLSHLFSATESEEEAKSRSARFAVLAKELQELPGLADCRDLTQYCMNSYPEQLSKEIRTVKTAGISAPLIAAFKKLYEQFPGAAGIAIDYADLLRKKEKNAEAIEVLQSGGRTACDERGRSLCRRKGLYMQIFHEYNHKKQPARAIESGIELAKEDDESPFYLEALFDILDATATQESIERWIQPIDGAVGGWLSRARQKLADFKATMRQPEHVCTSAEIDAIDEKRKALPAILCFSQMMQAHRDVVAAAKASKRDEQERQVAKSIQLATELLAHSHASDDHKEQAQKLLAMHDSSDKPDEEVP